MKKIFLSTGLLLSLTIGYGQNNTHVGTGAGNAGTYNCFYGYYSGASNTGGYNVGVGGFALRNNTGSRSTSIGHYSLYANTTGNENVALGFHALRYNTTGYENTAVGSRALRSNTTGYHNVAVGQDALHDNTTGILNTVLGVEALKNNTRGSSNVVLGRQAMLNSTEGSYNSVVGVNALQNNTYGSSNVAIGMEALNDNTGGYYNVAVGERSLRGNEFGNYNTGIGQGTYFNSVNHSYSTALGAYATITASSQVRIGDNWVGSIGGYQSWSNVSDGRFKKAVKENVLGLEFINALRPVSYQLDAAAIDAFLGKEVNKERQAASNRTTYQTGFIAQEVEATAKKLGFEQFSGVDTPKNEKDHYGLRYAEFVVPLVKSVQELSAQNEALKEALAQQQEQINQLLAAQQLSTPTPATTDKAQLHQNIPNPHQGHTQIKVFIPESSQQAFLQVTDLSGKQLLIKNIDQLGTSIINLQTKDLEAGMYLYTLVVDQEIVATKKMVIAQ